jgi:hypothetical protein
MRDWDFAVGRGACARGPAHPSAHDLQSFEPEAKIDCGDRRQHQNVRVIFQSQLKRHVDRNPQTPRKASWSITWAASIKTSSGERAFVV